MGSATNANFRVLERSINPALASLGAGVGRCRLGEQGGCWDALSALILLVWMWFVYDDDGSVLDFAPAKALSFQRKRYRFNPDQG
jgi:hypothetical protein